MLKMYRSALYLFYFICVTHVFGSSENANILCTEEVCSSIDCSSIPKECQIQNATDNGIFLKSPTTCNCCKYCLVNLGANDFCVSGSPGGSVPSVICGDGLSCNQNDVCEQMDTPCTREQNDYDNRKSKGLIGHLEVRPKCDRQGKFQPVICIPGETCFCVNENKKRIFGEIPYTPQADFLTKCGCSRDNDKIDETLNDQTISVLQRPRCLADGNYDTLQCINKQCICVDKENASPMDPKKDPVFVGYAPDLPCYDEEIHSDSLYGRPCEREYKKMLNLTKTAEKDHFDTYLINFPNCQFDGRFAPVQENRTHKYCVDPNNEILGDFIVEKNDFDNTMNCYCARARSIIKEVEKPECSNNGNYNPMQCRRGKCRCVDSNGVQTRQEVDEIDANTLKCSY